MGTVPEKMKRQDNWRASKNRQTPDGRGRSSGPVFWYNVGMKAITTSQFSFENVVKGGYVYVDKTDLLARLAKSVGGQFFISRPRRFGKSLMLSTLKCIFEGRTELFEGLKITKTDYDWKTFPVLHLDMSNVAAGSIEGLNDGLHDLVAGLAQQLGVTIESSPDAGVYFGRLWKAVTDRNLQVVVLIDEYDMPLQGYLNDPESFERVRKMMHDFYVRLKSYSGNIRFLMLTGVTKLAKLSIFSGLNNLTDLTMSADYAGLLGYTHDELKEFFAEHIAAFAEKKGVSSDAIFAQLLEWYDNYRFSPDNDVKVLNPVSVGSALNDCAFRGYWNATGAPTLVIEALRKSDKWPADLDRVKVKAEQLDVCDALTMPAVPLLYQGGYLTIKDVGKGDILHLGIPNDEVRSAITMGHINSLVGANKGSDFCVASVEASLALEDGDLDEAIKIFRSAVAALPYEWLVKDEGASKVMFLNFFNVTHGTKLTAERETANGRIDAIVETKDAVYIFEFKYNRSAQEAFDQILANGYHLPYLSKPRARHCEERSDEAIHKPVYGIGLNFNPEKGNRGIDEAVVNVIQQPHD